MRTKQILNKLSEIKINLEKTKYLFLKWFKSKK